MNKDGINNFTASPGGSSEEIHYLRLQSCAASGKERKRLSYSIRIKLEAIACAENNSTARKPRHEKFVWMQGESKRKQSSRLQRKQTKGKDYTGCGRKPLSTELEERVLEWIHDMRARGQCVSRRAISKKGDII